MRTFALAVAAVLAVGLLTKPALLQQKGGEEETGPYDVVESWPQWSFPRAGYVQGSQGGVFAFNGSSVTIRDAVISNNASFGVSVSLKSSAQIASSTIQNNTTIPGPLPGTLIGGDGIRLVFGSGLFAVTPNSSVTGNAGFGVICTDGESSVIGTGPLAVVLGISGNTGGGVACTGF